MNTKIRRAIESDKTVFIEFAIKLSKFNRNHHDPRCKYDDYGLVLDAIGRKAEGTFANMGGDTLILIAELEGEPVGYALGRIFEEDETADNGTGRIALLDELFVIERARGFHLGQRLMDGVTDWIKQKGVSRVKLHTYSWNSQAARLYELNGFKQYAVSYEKFIES